MSFLRTNAMKTIAIVGVVIPPNKINNYEKFIFALLLKCICDHINHIQIYFVHTNAMEIVATVGMASPPSKLNKAEKLILIQMQSRQLWE